VTSPSAGLAQSHVRVRTISISHVHELAYRIQCRGQRFNSNSLDIFSLISAVHSASDRQYLCTVRYNT